MIHNLKVLGLALVAAMSMCAFCTQSTSRGRRPYWAAFEDSAPVDELTGCAGVLEGQSNECYVGYRTSQPQSSGQRVLFGVTRNSSPNSAECDTNSRNSFFHEQSQLNLCHV